MRALRIHAYGGPEVMRLDEVPVPQAKAGERLVKLAAASVNPIDWKMRHGLIAAPLPRIPRGPASTKPRPWASQDCPPGSRWWRTPPSVPGSVC